MLLPTANWGHAELIQFITSAVTKSATDYTFGIKLYIAAYLALDEIFNHIGNNEVDVSNAQFFTMFVLVTGLVSALHAGLEISKQKWLNTNSILAKLGRGTYQVLEALNASNANAFLLFGLSSYFSEVGDINLLYTAFGLFANVCLVGIILQIVSHYGKNYEKNIDRTLNSASAITFMSGIFAKPGRASFSTDELCFIAATFAAAALLSVFSAKLLPPVKSERQPSRLQIQGMWRRGRQLLKGLIRIFPFLLHRGYK